MKRPLATESLTEDGPDRLCIRAGGGCLSIFGIPFFAAGVFVCLMALGVLVPENADELPWWTWPVMLAMGLAFVAVGGHLVFGRRWISIDRTRGSIAREWGLLVPLTSEEFSLQSYSGVALRFDAGDSDTPDRYPILLQAQAGGADLALLSGADYASSRAKAERISAVTGLPLVDSTTDHESVHRPESLAATFRERVRLERASSAARPVSLRTAIEESDRGVRLTIPGPGFKPAMLLQLAIPLAFAAFALTQIIPFFDQTDTPEAVEWVFLGFLALFVLGPGAGGIASLVRAARSRTVVSASPAGIRLEERGAMRTRITDIPADMILDIDYGTTASRMESARQGAAAVRSVSVVRGSESTIRNVQLPRWVSFLGSLVPSKGVILKTRRGVFTFGSGLPDEEVLYLHDRVKRAVLN